MEKEELSKLVKAIKGQKDISEETVFQVLEESIAIAIGKQYNLGAIPVVTIDRKTAQIIIKSGDKQLDDVAVGRITYDTVKRLFAEKLRDRHMKTKFDEMVQKKGSVQSVKVLRFDKRDVICEVAPGVEGFIPKNEQIRGEGYSVGKQIMALLIDVEMRDKKLCLVYSRSRPEMVLKLFEREIPEISRGIVKIMSIARDPGYRTKIIVTSNNAKVDPQGVCIGAKGARIRLIVDELGGENIDIIKWVDNPAELIRNALKPAEIDEIEMNEQSRQATVYISKEHLSYAIGRGGRNVRLASRLVDWEINIYPVEGAPADGGEAGAETQTGENPGEAQKQ